MFQGNEQLINRAILIAVCVKNRVRDGRNVWGMIALKLSFVHKNHISQLQSTHHWNQQLFSLGKDQEYQWNIPCRWSFEYTLLKIMRKLQKRCCDIIASNKPHDHACKHPRTDKGKCSRHNSTAGIMPGLTMTFGHATESNAVCSYTWNVKVLHK